MDIQINTTNKLLTGTISTKLYKNVIKSYGLKWTPKEAGWKYDNENIAQFLHDGIKDGTLKPTDIKLDFNEDEEKVDKSKLVQLDMSNVNYSLLKTRTMAFNEVIKKNGGRWDKDLNGWVFTGYAKPTGVQIYNDIITGTLKPKLSVEERLTMLELRIQELEDITN